MKSRNGLFLLAVIAASLSHTAGAGYKCWTNNEGTRECGSAIPPEYAEQDPEYQARLQAAEAAAEPPPPTEEELAEQKRQQEALEAQQREEERQRAEEQARADELLLASYRTEQDIVAAMNLKLSGLDAAISGAEQDIVETRQQLNEEQQQAMELARMGQLPDAQYQARIDSLNAAIEEKESFIEACQVKRAEVNSEFGAYLNRFRELQHSAASSAR